MSPTATKIRTAVCLISSHSFFLTQFQSLLSNHGVRAQIWEIDGRFLDHRLNAAALPAASIYVLDSQSKPELTAILVSEILAARPQSHLLAVGEKFAEEGAFPLLRAGVQGLVNYSDAPEQLHRAVEALAGGGYWVPRTLLFRFIDSILSKRNGNGNKRLALAGVRVSQREQQILQFLLNNLSNKEIGSQLNISERTVKFHVSNLLAKYGVQRRADLILLAYQNKPAPEAG